MKKIFLLLALATVVPAAFGQTLFTYGNTPVSKAEFLRAYNKNRLDTADKEKALRQYLELYTRFKIKVKAAEDLHLDTLQQLKNDLENFRSQIQDSYLNDEEGINELLNQVIIRNQKEIQVHHFYLSLKQPVNTEDAAKAAKAMAELQAGLKNNGINEAEQVNAISKKYLPVVVQDLGFVKALSMPYEMENLVYALKPGEISNSYSTKTGLHLFKNVAERKSRGKWTVAQILFNLPPGADEIKIKAIKKTADSVSSLLEGGADFTLLAQHFSDDAITAQNGGLMPAFGTGRFEPAFESKVFELKKDGDISAPIHTSFGYHIVKRIQVQAAVIDKANDSVIQGIKQQIIRDSRMTSARENFIRTISAKTSFKRSAIKKEELFGFADSALANKLPANHPFQNKLLFSFKKENIYGRDWINFITRQRINNDPQAKESHQSLLDKFISASTLNYYSKYLEEFNLDFKYQLEEFKAGSLLFEVMEKMVWSKASGDSMGLQQFYEANKQKYLWDKSARVLLFNCSDSKAADAATAALQSGIGWEQIRDKSEGKVQVDSGRYEIAQLPIPASMVFKEGAISAPVVNRGDKSAVFVQVLQLFPGQQQRSLMESRGLIINDYQTFIEDQWLKLLKKKYPIIINEAVYKAIAK